MPETQLRLFPPARPLTERFGAKFFRGLPKNPGVYLMSDSRGKILYVGQSQNLRERVSSYRHVHPDRSSRKLVRLVHSVERIEWEICPTHEEARVRENHLLREHRPRFNTINVWPRGHWFAGMRLENEQIEFSFTREWPQEDDGFYGAFKSSGLPGFASLLRLLWAMSHPCSAESDYPRLLINERPPKQFVLDLPTRLHFSKDELVGLLTFFFRGESLALLEWLRGKLPDEKNISLFHQKLLCADLERVENFFQFGPSRNAQLCRAHGLTERLIRQEALNDLLVSPVSSRAEGST